MARILTVLRRILSRIGKRWIVAKDGWAAIRPTWIAALITIGVAIALQNAQALDALKEIADGPASPRLTLFGSVLLLAFAAWYFPRALLYVKYAHRYLGHVDHRKAASDRQLRRLLQRVRQLRHLLPGIRRPLHRETDLLRQPAGLRRA